MRVKAFLARDSAHCDDATTYFAAELWRDGHNCALAAPFSLRASGTVGVFSRSQSPLSVLFRLAQATARHTGLIRGAAKRDIIAVLKFNRYDYRASRV